jgi:hypothetical protein
LRKENGLGIDSRMFKNLYFTLLDLQTLMKSVVELLANLEGIAV